MTPSAHRADQVASRIARCAGLTVLATVVVSATGGSSRVESTQAASPSPSWQAWSDAVNAHVPGQRDEAVQRVAPWSRGQLESVLPRLRSLANQARDSTSGNVALVRTIERALVLHADIAILHRVPNGYDGLAPAETTRATTLFEDGRAIGQMSGTFHWEFARRVLDVLLSGDDSLRIGRLFYRSTAAVLQSWGEYPEFSAHVLAGRRFLRDDAVLLLYEGTQRQAYAGPRLQRFFDERRRSQSREQSTLAATPSPNNVARPRDIPSLPEALPSASASRTQAEALFRRALTFDPTLAEARVRLAHVLGDRGRHDEAAAELERAMATPATPFVDYYAALIAGREARARGELDAARGAFERAITIYPNASAPRYGLSELAMARGDRAEGLAYLLKGAEVARVEANEPWWWIDRVHEPSAEALIGDLRRMVVR